MIDINRNRFFFFFFSILAAMKFDLWKFKEIAILFKINFSPF